MANTPSPVRSAPSAGPRVFTVAEKKPTKAFYSVYDKARTRVYHHALSFFHGLVGTYGLDETMLAMEWTYGVPAGAEVIPCKEGGCRTCSQYTEAA